MAPKQVYFVLMKELLCLSETAPYGDYIYNRIVQALHPLYLWPSISNGYLFGRNFAV